MRLLVESNLPAAYAPLAPLETAALHACIYQRASCKHAASACLLLPVTRLPCQQQCLTAAARVHETPDKHTALTQPNN
jgi:hypothetical protein